MKVNMTPNPLDVVTIHASQGDTEARQWEFELHNNGELIDTSDVTEQMFFKAYEDGTEQLLPENTSTPTTSPFLGDIRYPQGLLTDQEFLYRQSPTEEDGNAKITDIKGNTLVWNQLVQNGNFESTSGWTPTRGTVSASGNVLSYTYSEVAIGSVGNRIQRNVGTVSGHSYLLSVDAKLSKAKTILVLFTSNGTYNVQGTYSANTWKNVHTIVKESSNSTYVGIGFNADSNNVNGDVEQIRNFQVFDLTEMFGAGNEPATAEEFTSLFPLSYYSYNKGSLLSFNGNGIKTTGKNLNPWTGVDYIASTSRTVFLKKGDYVFSTDNGNNFEGSTQIYICLADSNGNNITSGGITSGYLSLNDSGTFYYGGYGRNNIPFTLNFDAFVSFGFNNRRPTNFSAVQLEFGSVATDYEPYTSSTLSLPISTYFPNGMKSAGSVYDELTPRKAITRIGSADLGSFNWSYNDQYQCFTTYPVLTDSKYIDSAVIPNFTSIYRAVSWSAGATDAAQDMAACFLSSANQLRIRNKNFTDATTFKSAMNGVYLYYELATPTETSFTTASLVTENGEIPLSNEDGTLIGKCTEQLSENPGFIDAKIKLSDGDGECYSNKIQLHVERSPQ